MNGAESRIALERREETREERMGGKETEISRGVVVVVVGMQASKKRREKRGREGETERERERGAAWAQ